MEPRPLIDHKSNLHYFNVTIFWDSDGDTTEILWMGKLRFVPVPGMKFVGPPGKYWIANEVIVDQTTENISVIASVWMPSKTS